VGKDQFQNYVADFTTDTPSVAAVGGGGIVLGAGSPEGAVVASPGREYMNSTTGELWLKHTGDGNTGWRLIG
jgi:hypothetical protein